MRCVPTKGTCGSTCTQNGGRCVRNGTACCHKKDEDDKNNLVRDGGAAETGAENIADNANATIVDEGYLFYNGMTLRCTKAKCTKKCTESRGGFCMEGKCCYKKTENEAQSQCATEKKHVLKGRPIVAGQNTDDEHLHCTVGGSYLARCKGQACHCLNAGSGERIGKPKKVTSMDKINCDKEQNKTKPKRIRIIVKLSDNPLSAYGQPEKDAMKSALRDNLEKKYPVDAEIELYDGSVMANVNLGLCADDCAATAQTTDLFSISTAVVSEINEGSILFEVNGETIIPSGAAIQDIQTAEMLQNLEKEMTKTLEVTEKEMMVTIITVTAVVVVVLFVLGLAVACYGKDNPSYIYHLEGGR
ncbi:uncharacterized protein LOC132716902 [Ruditapes philippinarum]|uniref:uncharacterized protein LOC132716902 n=1 Tax=Ruditapes philippinarum TaxID=129788 RepID=UPI00295A99E4|nr:uncharacterized protein LOC132716902 [Ruditapes philippinarum]